MTISAAGPAHLVHELHEALAPYGHTVSSDHADPHLRIVALPWCGDNLFGSQFDEEKPVLPLRFDLFSVTVGPFLTAAGPCPTCTLPAILAGATRPLFEVEASLFAAAAHACALYVRTVDSHSTHITSLSLTIDSRTPVVEHRLWTCLPGCRHETAA